MQQRRGRLAAGWRGLVWLGALWLGAACSQAEREPAEGPGHEAGVGGPGGAGGSAGEGGAGGGDGQPDAAVVRPAPPPDAGAGGAGGEGGAGGTGGTGGVPAQRYVGLVFNEVAAAGEPDDWFELYNGGPAPLDLGGVTFSDDPERPQRARFAQDTWIAPGAFALVWVSDETVGFRLGQEEQLVLHSPAGERLDAVAWREGESPRGKSFGRVPDGTGDWRTLDLPSPGASNREAPAPRCGDGRAEGDEACDGADLRGQTCVSQGFAGGELACDGECEWRLEGCRVPASRVVINEVTSAGDDQIELFNAGDAGQDLAGWLVADGDYDPQAPREDKRYAFPEGSNLEPGGFLVLTKGVEHPFGIGSADGLFLFDAEGAEVDQVSWADGEARIAWCRIPDGDGPFQRCDPPTFGARNAP